MFRSKSSPYSHRFSATFTSKRTSVVDKVDARISSDRLSLSVITFPDSPLSKNISDAINLQEALHYAELAEAPTEPYLILENKYPALRALRTDIEIGDGLWICCYCHHENILRHWKGRFPFKYLHCDRCSRKLCSDCHTSEILTPWPVGIIHVPPPRAGREVRYCHICTTCGLTHRAEMEDMTLDFYGVLCAGCGSSSYGDWPRYHIGNVEPYRRDPDSTFAKLVDARADHAAKLAFQWEITNLPSSSGSELNGSTADAIST